MKDCFKACAHAGFKKCDSDSWEFTNSGFVQGKKEALQSIQRRKPSAVRKAAEGDNGTATSAAGMTAWGLVPHLCGFFSVALHTGCHTHAVRFR